ncbi:MAG: branched-chain amino acid ABC transporter substrate-binding protein [Actinobacteria bacterium]|nr:branched-chain amino acid ABC transporter substrate-binding protein [Actinomycetota bacterium]MCG2806888.1 branched-chain amino acid ABC transporter substrate-binding protein [Coriobacteriia bacterium]
MTHKTLQLTSLLLACALTFALAASGCAAKDDTAKEAEPSAITEVKLGFAAPLTGDNAVYGLGMKRAVELAFKEANSDEDVKGKGYEFVLRAEDDQGDPKQAVNVANALAGDTEVVGVIGHFNSGCSIPASTVYDKAGLTMISVSSNPELTAKGYPVVNRIVAKDDAQGKYAAELLLDKVGYKKVAVVDDSTQYGQGLAQEFVTEFTAKGGTVMANEKIQSKEVDFSALVTKLKALAPDAVYFAGAHTEGALITKQMKEAGFMVPLIGGDLIFADDFISIAGAANAEGDVATILGLPLEQQPRGADFKAAYEAEYGEAPQAYDSYAYDQAWIYVNAIMQVGPDRAALVDAVRNGSFDGVTGVTEFDANGDTKNQVISWYSVKNGKWVQGE